MEKDTKTADMHIRVSPKQKATWIKVSKEKGMRLSAWVVDTLDKEAVSP